MMNIIIIKLTKADNNNNINLKNLFKDINLVIKEQDLSQNISF